MNRSILPALSTAAICLSILATPFAMPAAHGAVLSPSDTDVDLQGFFTANPVRVGQAVALSINVFNNAAEDANSVVLSTTVPANAVFNAGMSTISPAWSCPDGSTPGTICTLALTSVLPQFGFVGAMFALTATQPQLVGNPYITSTITVSTSNTDGNLANNTIIRDVLIDLRDIRATKTQQLLVDNNNNGLGDGGDEISYTIAITNSGIVTIGNLLIDDPYYGDPYGYQPRYADVLTNTITATNGTITVNVPQPGGWSVFSVGLPNFAPNATTRISYRERIRANYTADAIETSNRAAAYVTTQFGGIDVLALTNIVTTALTPKADLVVTKSGSQAIDGSTNFSISYYNQGRAALSNVVLTETIPSGAALHLPETNPNWQCSNGTCTFLAGPLAGYGPNDSFFPAGTVTFAITSTAGTPMAMTSVTNVVKVGHVGAPPETELANNVFTATAAFGARATYTVTKQAVLVVDQRNDGKAQLGDIIEYTVRVTNTSSSRYGAGVSVNDSSMVPFFGSPLSVLADTISVSQGSYQQNGSDISTNFGTLAPGASATLRYRASMVLLPDRQTGSIYNAAAVLDQYGYTTAIAELRTPVYYSQNLAIGKSVAVTRTDGLVDMGGTLTYTVRVTSTGDTAATGFYLRDGGLIIYNNNGTECISIYPPFSSTLPGALSYVGGSFVSGFELAMDPLAPGVSGTVVFTATADCPTGAAVNRAELFEFSTIHNQNRKLIMSSNNTAVTIRGPRTGVFGQSIVTQHAQPAVARGETITISTVITNAGTEALTNVTFYNSNYSCFTIVPGSVTSSQGSATLLGDPPAVSANLGNLPVGATASIAFRATVSTLGSCAEISNMGVFQDGSGNLGNSPTLTRPVVSAHPPTTRYVHLPLVRR